MKIILAAAAAAILILPLAFVAPAAAGSTARCGRCARGSAPGPARSRRGPAIQ